jgi:hypothetical protein
MISSRCFTLTLFASLSFGLCGRVVAQTTFNLNAYGRDAVSQRDQSVLTKIGATRLPAGTAITSDGLTTTHPAGALIRVTSPTTVDNGTALTFQGWSPTNYDATSGYVAAVTTNPLDITLDADRKLIGWWGYSIATMLNTPNRAWTTGGHALWTGSFDVFGPSGGGLARAALLENIGDEAWLESTYSAPGIINYSWRLDIPTAAGARLETLLNGVISDSQAVDSSGWKGRTVELSGNTPVRVRFRLTHTAVSSISILVNKRGTAYLADVASGSFSAPTKVQITSTSDTSATLIWPAGFGATSYTAELSTDADFTSIAKTQLINVTSVPIPATMTTSFYGLTANTRYYARVLSNRATYTSLASPVRSFIAKVRLAQTITFPAIPNKFLAGVPFLAGATVSSNLPISYTISDSRATISVSGLVTFTGLGDIPIKASQHGDDDYEPAPDAYQSFNSNFPPGARLTLAPATRTYNGLPQSAAAVTTPPGLPPYYTYRLGTAPATTTPPTNPGTYTVTARIPVFLAPTSTSTLKINKATLSVFGVPMERLIGQPNPPLSLTYTGFVAADDASVLDTAPVPVCKAVAKSPQGKYPITFSGGLDNNYQFAAGTPAEALTVQGFGGIYEALITEPGNNQARGKLTLTVTTTGLNYTGSLTLDSESAARAVPAAQILTAPDASTASDTFSITVAATKTQPAVTYEIDFTLTDQGVLTGSIKVASISIGTLTAGRKLYVVPAKTTSPWKGSYTLHLYPVQPSTNPLPEGAGHAVATIDTSGKLTLVGNLADGTPLSTSAQADPDGTYRIYAKPHGTRLGQRFGGVLALTTHPDLTNRFRAAKADWVWSKPALSTDTSYRAGIGPVLTQAELELWLPPVARIPAKGTIPEVPAITLSERLGIALSPTVDAGLPLSYISSQLSVFQKDELPNFLIIKPTSVVTYPPQNTSLIKLVLTPTTGRFTGEFTVAEIPVPPARPVTRKALFTGMMRQGPTGDKLIAGDGHFILPGLPGAPSTEKTSGEIKMDLTPSGP